MANDYDSAPDIAERQRALQRRQAIMDAMVASSMRAQPTQMAGRIAIRQSPFEALSRVATAYMGNRGQSGIDKEYGELSAESQKRRREEIAKLLPGSELADAFGSDDPIVRRIAADKMKASQPKPKLTTYYENGKERRGVIDLSNPGSAPTPIGGDKPTDPNKPFNPDGTPNEEFQKYELERRAAARTNVTTIVGAGEKKYAEQRQEDAAKAMTKLGEAAAGAYRSNQEMDRFLAASAKGLEGGAQPAISMAQNLLATFGYSAESLTDVRKMEQAISEVLSTRMNELGARGLTDRDMEVLRAALPRVNTDRQAREDIARIVKRSNDAVLNEYDNMMGEEERIAPGVADRIPTPFWYKNYKSQQSASSPPEGVAPELWEVMTPEERALWQK